MIKTNAAVFWKNTVVNLLFILACNANCEEFKSVGAHADFKLISFTSQSNMVEDGDLVEFKCLYLKNNIDTLLSDSTYLNELFNDTLTYRENNSGALMLIINKLQEGDSCLARFYKGDLILGRLNLKKNKVEAKDTIFAYIKLKHIYKGKEKMAYLLEENAIARYITYSKNDWKATENGIFYRIVKASNKNKIVNNDVIKLVYKGYFLNNKVFDNYADNNPYFEFVAGTQHQLIKGMEIAIKYMSCGTEAEFIFPSSLAFGPKGSSTGIVPGHKPLLYKVKILENISL